MHLVRQLAAVASLLIAAACGHAGVVINEILYHAPDDLDKLQFVELHNTGDKAVDLAGWRLDRDARFTFPSGTRIEANGFVVVCKDQALMKKWYGIDALGPFERTLSHGGDRIDLLDAKGKRVDSVKFKTRAPWPVAADGSSSSLERICPTAPSDVPENWAPSPLPAKSPKPSGTPGKTNANYSVNLPPIISDVKQSARNVNPNQEIEVSANVRSDAEVSKVELRYRLASSGKETDEKSVPMTKSPQGRYSARIPGQTANQIVRFRLRAEDARQAVRFVPSENEVRPAYSVLVHEPYKPGAIPFGFVINVGAAEFRAAQRGAGPASGRYGEPSPEPPPRGNSAFVFVNAKTAEPELFDFINVTPRGGGCKVRFHKEQMLDGMSTINLIFEGVDRFVLAEPLAYEVYRKAGNAACRTDFVRTWIDGRPIGYQLLIEQPNKAFVRNAHLRTDGNMYKIIWFGRGLIGQHEKKTHTHEGHDDLVKLVGDMDKLKGDEQWEFIKKNFDVEQVINYFAVNMLLSHWDGFFNNYFAYHDVNGTGKWTMYPWDQDKTWGFHDGIRGYEVFFDMPVTFGMAGDRPPGWPRLLPPPPGFGGGAIWWRPGGFFSRPLLAQPTFRKHFLARTRELAETVYTEAVFFPLIGSMGERLQEDVKIRAELQGQDPKEATEHLRRNLDSLREHLVKRREFLLKQDEIKNAGKFDRTALK